MNEYEKVEQIIQGTIVESDWNNLPVRGCDAADSITSYLTGAAVSAFLLGNPEIGRALSELRGLAWIRYKERYTTD